MFNRKIWALLLVLIVSGLLHFIFVTPPLHGDWQEVLAVPSTALVEGDKVTVQNIRDFRYNAQEIPVSTNRYTQTFELSKLQKVWYVTEPFAGQDFAAHTFLSFEFENNEFLAVSIEARKTKDQSYSGLKGVLRTYPLIYMAASERDVVLMRANIRKDRVYAYPVKFSAPENKQKLFLSVVNKMNELVTTKPAWYNTIWASCTSSIRHHVADATGKWSPLSWKMVLSGYADEYALDHGFLDTDLPIEKAREKYQINTRSEQAGDSKDYSVKIRQ